MNAQEHNVDIMFPMLSIFWYFHASVCLNREWISSELSWRNWNLELRLAKACLPPIYGSDIPYFWNTMTPTVTVLGMSSVLLRNNQIIDVLTSMERERPSSSSGLRTSEAYFVASGIRTSWNYCVPSGFRTSDLIYFH